MKRLSINSAVLVILVVAALSLAAVASARNWKADLYVEPAQPVIGTNVVGGCGFVPSEFLKLYVIHEDASVSGGWTGYDFNLETGADGCFRTTFQVDVPALYQIWAYQPNKGRGLLTARSMIEFTVA